MTIKSERNAGRVNFIKLHLMNIHSINKKEKKTPLFPFYTVYKRKRFFPPIFMLDDKS